MSAAIRQIRTAIVTVWQSVTVPQKRCNSIHTSVAKCLSTYLVSVVDSGDSLFRFPRGDRNFRHASKDWVIGSKQTEPILRLAGRPMSGLSTLLSKSTALTMLTPNATTDSAKMGAAMYHFLLNARARRPEKAETSDERYVRTNDRRRDSHAHFKYCINMRPLAALTSRLQLSPRMSC